MNTTNDGIVRRFQDGMKKAVAQFYSQNLSENIKRALEQKRRNGEWTGTARLGYSCIESGKGKNLHKDIIIDPERGHLVKKMFELYATGNYTLDAMEKEISNLGLRTANSLKLSKSYILKILQDSFYCGIAMSKKYGSYPHKYACIVDKQLFDKCQRCGKLPIGLSKKLSTYQYLHCKGE